MTTNTSFEIFLTATPALESLLADEAREKGFPDAAVIPGGVTFMGSWQDVMRANLTLRGATRVLARIGAFRAMHLAQLDKRSRKFPFGEILRPDVPVKVEVTCKASRIYHAGAAAQRIEKALAESHGIQISADAPLRIKARIDDDLCTFSIDTSGESLHKRGHKEAVGKAPMRETLAALFLRECGYDGSQTLYDPMCGSGTFVIEAAEIAMGLHPGRSRPFAFEQLANFDVSAWQTLRAQTIARTPSQHFYGSDRDAGAIRMARANAERAGVAAHTTFTNLSATDITPPDGPPGLVIVNPPYGSRIGQKKLLYAVYAQLGKALLERFKSWRVGMITSDPALAKASGLPFAPPGPNIPHGGLRVNLYQTGPLR